MMRYAFIFASFACVLGCSAQSTSKQTEVETVSQFKAYTLALTCENEFQLTLRADDAESMSAAFPAETLQLKQARAASGVKYQSQNTFVWLKGDDAMVQYNEILYKNCRIKRTEAL